MDGVRVDAQSRVRLQPQAGLLQWGKRICPQESAHRRANQVRHFPSQVCDANGRKWTFSSLQSPRPFRRGRPLVTRSATAWTSTTPSGHCTTAQSEYGPSVCMIPGVPANISLLGRWLQV
jgi:hypothetical protein